MPSDITIDVDNKLYYFDETILPCINSGLIYKDKYNQLLHTKHILNLVYTTENKYNAITNWVREGSNNMYEEIKLTCITGYSWPDNDPAKTGNIAYNKDDISNSYIAGKDYPKKNLANFKRNAMGGTGTYDDPITVAVPQYNYAECGLTQNNTVLDPKWLDPTFCINNSKDNSKENASWLQKVNLEAGNIYYMPYFKKYFVVEDQCDITRDSGFCAPNHFDIYIGPPTKDSEYTRTKINNDYYWKVNQPEKINSEKILDIEDQFSWPLEGWPYCPKTNEQIQYAIDNNSFLSAYKIINGKPLLSEKYPVDTKSFYDQFNNTGTPVVFCNPDDLNCKGPYIDNSGGPANYLKCSSDKSQAVCGKKKGTCTNCNGLGFLCNNYEFPDLCCPNNICTLD